MDWDIIIVGSGPAGLSTGLHLAHLAPELARRTLILERERHPRPKPCAGGIMPGGATWLRRLGLDLDEVPSVEVQEAHFLFEGHGFVVRREPFVFRIVRREEFDAWLANAARKRELVLQEGTRVRRLRFLEDVDAVEVETDRGPYRARAVVGADGSTGVVRRAIVRERPPPRVSRLLEILVPADRQASTSLGLGLDKRRVTIDFSWIAAGLQGYVWDFPTQVQQRPVRTHGVFDSCVHPKAPRASLKDTLQEALARTGVALDHDKLKGHPLRWFHPRGVFSASHVLLVGDAAGVDPLLGEGISFALGYGDVAARALQDAFARNDFSFADYRDQVSSHRIGRCLRQRAAVASVLYRIRNHRLLCLMRESLGPLVGWLAEHFLVGWGDQAHRRFSTNSRPGDPRKLARTSGTIRPTQWPRLNEAGNPPILGILNPFDTWATPPPCRMVTLTTQVSVACYLSKDQGGV